MLDGWLDKEGRSIDLHTFAQLHMDESYVRVGKFVSPCGTVSTVWLGRDHRFGGDGPPIIFETLVFGGPLDGEMDRYCTEAEATAGHRAMVDRLTRTTA